MGVNEVVKLKVGEALVPEFTEFETKYRTEPHQLIKFKQLMNAAPEEKKLLYVEGPDYYYVKPGFDDAFARYRKPAYGLDGGRCEVTIKVKPKGAKNNIIRKELNWRVDNTPQESVEEGLELLGFKFNFSIYKTCQIYFFQDATVVFYTVYDITEGAPSKTDTFIEIEVKEEGLSDMTENAAWAVIEKYEKLLAPLELSAQKRLRRSLFEMYRRGV